MAAHVNPNPDPADLWPFAVEQERIISYDPFLSFRVTRIGEFRIHGIQTLGEVTVRGSLPLNHPCVIVRAAETGEPMVTLTLRKIEDGKAYLQVTGNPVIPVGRRDH